MSEPGNLGTRSRGPPADRPRGSRPRYPGRSGRRAVYSLVLVGAVLTIGTVGFHVIEGAGFVDAFYFESMLATGQGPPFQLFTTAGKLFASAMAFISVGSVITSLVFVLGPFLSQLWREGIGYVEGEARKLGREIEEDLSGHRHDGGPPPQ